MSEKTIWLFAFVAAYWAYCVYWGVTSARLAGTAGDYFLADRRLPPWVFVVAATAASFTGWMFLGQPAYIYRDGFQFAQLSLCAIGIPLTGVVFLKRQWLLGRRFGYATPGDMFADYFGSETMRLLVLVVAWVFAIPFLGMQLTASGRLIEILSDGTVDRHLATWVLTAVVFLYVCFGGMRAVAYVGTLQGLLLAAGLVTIGLIAFGRLGGFGAFNQAMAGLGATTLGPWGTTAQGYNGYFEIPGVIQFTDGLGREAPVGGPWTATMILSYAFALTGIQAAPAFTMWAFGSRSLKGFAPQQVWASAAVVGLVLVFFAAAVGMGAHFLGASAPVTQKGLAVAGWLAPLAPERPIDLVAGYVAAIADRAPWFGGLLAVCALAAVQALAAWQLAAAGVMFAHDLHKRHIRPEAGDRLQKLFARIGVGLVALVALLAATYAPASVADLGALALGFGAQLWPALAAVCWVPWLTRQGVVLGLVAGLAGVVLTEPFGADLAAFFGVTLPWGRWPWTVHSAGWGIVSNVAVCLLVSAVTQRHHDRRRAAMFHAFLARSAPVAPGRPGLRPVAWALALVWLFFALGPGAVVGNDLFGAPNAGIEAWVVGVPSIWAWQILWWALGVVMIWFLAYKMEMSTGAARELDIPAGAPGAPARPVRPVDWHRAFWIAAAVAAVIAFAHWMFG
ncbi:MAG: sodium:solute symporter family protein [Rhodospirillaceae bacterium]|nr:sodium:solute symporter family protein [Rhodospirillaceae bacterium]